MTQKLHANAHRIKPTSPVQWFVDPADWPGDKYPPWAHGAGYVLTKVLCKLVLLARVRRLAEMQCACNSACCAPGNRA